MATFNWNSLGNYVLVVVGLSATYLASINELKYAGFAAFIALVIKGLLSEAQNQSDNSTAAPAATTANQTVTAHANTKYVKIRTYFTRHFWLY